MSTTRKRTGCRCVSDKIALHLYADDHGPCAVVIFANGTETEATARIRTAKIRCLKCGLISLEKIPHLPPP